jgi:hypothetical protein
VLFNESILHNVAYGRPGAPWSEVAAAAAAAQLDAAVGRMPQVTGGWEVRVRWIFVVWRGRHAVRSGLGGSAPLQRLPSPAASCRAGLAHSGGRAGPEAQRRREAARGNCTGIPAVRRRAAMHPAAVTRCATRKRRCCCRLLLMPPPVY